MLQPLETRRRAPKRQRTPQGARFELEGRRRGGRRRRTDFIPLDRNVARDRRLGLTIFGRRVAAVGENVQAETIALGAGIGDGDGAGARGGGHGVVGGGGRDAAEEGPVRCEVGVDDAEVGVGKAVVDANGVCQGN